MKKRIISLLLALLMPVLMAVGVCAAGQTELILSMPQTLPAVGETFTVSVDISGNPGFRALEIELQYNQSVLKCTKASTGAVSREMLSASNTAYSTSSAKMAGASPETVTGEGPVAVFTFRVLASGDSGLAVSDVLLSGKDSVDIPYSLRKVQTTASQTEKSGDFDVKDGSEAEDVFRPAGAFRDVPPDYWGYAQIERAAELGLAAGFEDGTFRPDGNVTRAQFVLMLWRMAGKPAPQSRADFSDAKAGWYQTALSWASENGYVNGVGNGKFNPDGSITRQEAMTILFRYSGSQSGTELLFTSRYDSIYADSGKIAAWAKPAVYWAVYKGILSGVGEDRIAPEKPATRAQIAVILLRYMDKFSNEEEVG